MKKTKVILVAMIMSTGLAACGSKGTMAPETESVTKTVKETLEDMMEETVEEPTEVMAEEISTVEMEDNAQSAAAGYEDNFAVDAEAAAAFADKIKAAVAAKDIEELADLTSFPVYVGIAEGGVETREDFIALGAEKIFTPELTESIAGADTSNLTPSMAGFSISKEGKLNIIFGVVEGRLAISGINY